VKIALATDHAGLEQLKELQEYLEDKGHSCVNFGPKSLNSAEDYPDFIFPAAKAVASGECDRGIIMGGSGQGEAMAANRITGIRCALYYGPSVAKKVIDAEGRVSHNPSEIVKLSREHNDANVLSLAARFVTLSDMKSIVDIWLDTPFSDDPRHKRRIEKLDKGSK
jgi:ribose 5-phosphate isomerase B